MRRFDKHRIESSSTPSVSSPVFQKEIQERLQAREQEDRLLYSSQPSSHQLSVSSSSVSSSSVSSSSVSSSSVSSSSTMSYTPWKTPTTPSQ